MPRSECFGYVVSLTVRQSRLRDNISGVDLLIRFCDSTLALNPIAEEKLCCYSSMAQVSDHCSSPPERPGVRSTQPHSMSVQETQALGPP